MFQVLRVSPGILLILGCYVINMKKLLLLIVFDLLVIVCQGQYLNKFDSLKIMLTKEKSDTGKVILLY